MDASIAAAPPGRRSTPQVIALVREAAARLSLSVEILDPEYGHLFRLHDRQRSVTLLGGRSPLNDAVAARICEDKYYTAMVLQATGIRTPAGVRCLKPDHFQLEDYRDRAGREPGRSFAREHGFPVVVKPNRLSHGRAIYLTYDQAEMDRAIDRVWRHDYLALVQEPVPGIDLRIDILDDEFLAGYYRHPSESTDREHEVDLLNLAQGARAEVLEEVSPEWLDCCRVIGRIMNLRHYGIDFKLPAADAPPDRVTVIEVNSSPLLVQLYKLGYVEEAVSGQTRVLRAIMDGRP